MTTPLYLVQIEHIKRRVCQHFAISSRLIVTDGTSIRDSDSIVKKANFTVRYLCWRFIEEKNEVIAAVFGITHVAFKSSIHQAQVNGLSRDIKEICTDIMHEDDDLFNIPPWERMLFTIMPDYHPSKSLKQEMQQLHIDIENRIVNSSDRQRFLLEGLKRQLKLENE